MARQRKSKPVLGQTKVKAEITEEKVEDLVVAEEIEKLLEEKNDEIVPEVVVPEEEVPEQPEQPEEPIEEESDDGDGDVDEEIIEEEAPKLRKVSDLNADEYKYYMNTGIILP